MRKRLIKMITGIVGFLVCALLLLWIALAQPSCRSNARSTATVDADALRAHVETLAVGFHPRNWRQLENLDACAAYISNHLARAGLTPEEQTYDLEGRVYRNVLARLGPEHTPRIIIGAHYDSCLETPGADDNASGVAVLLELATLLAAMDTPPPVELVAYTLEEPPFFNGPLMGSAVHAKRLGEDAWQIQGVIVLEMLGYFDDAWGSQPYPVPILHLIYPNRGNFVGVVSRWDQGPWIKDVKVALKGRTEVPFRSIRAPAIVPGIDLSDHRNYWPLGIPAVMLTDTAFLRNRAYHTDQDTPDRLDYERMAQVTVSVFEAVNALAAQARGGEG